MKKPCLAFTLVELLAVLAILAVLASILFPVLRAVQSQSHKVVCISNFKQITEATMLYGGDYDDRFVLVNHQPAEEPNSRNDRTWVQLILPYVRSFNVFFCPSDTSIRPRLEATFDDDLVPGDIYSQYYTASLRTNAGYNYQYLAPIVRVRNQWTAQPRSFSAISSPSRTLMYVDSVWQLRGGRPYGGGQWLVVPPCRFETVHGENLDSFTSRPSTEAGSVFTTSVGWEMHDLSSQRYGGAWPWHEQRMNVARTDGSVKSSPLASLIAGCDAQANWQGQITDRGNYIWDGG